VGYGAGLLVLGTIVLCLLERRRSVLIVAKAGRFVQAPRPHCARIDASPKESQLTLPS
jgi:hypothetical protein